MKKLLVGIALAVACVTGYGQTTNQPPILDSPIADTWLNFLKSGSNFLYAAYPIYSTGGSTPDGTKKSGSQFGAGVAVLYPISQYALVGLGFDYMNGGVTMPSVNAQLQLPVTLFGKVELTPLVYSGLATSIGGSGRSNGEAIGIFGTGLSVKINKHLSIFGSFEKRTSEEGNWIKLGPIYKF